MKAMTCCCVKGFVRVESDVAETTLQIPRVRLESLEFASGSSVVVFSWNVVPQVEGHFVCFPLFGLLRNIAHCLSDT